jgi:hypothetical protein
MNKPTGTPDAPRAVDAGMEAAREYCREEGYFSDSLNTWAMSARDAASFAAERTAALQNKLDAWLFELGEMEAFADSKEDFADKVTGWLRERNREHDANR